MCWTLLENKWWILELATLWTFEKAIFREALTIVFAFLFCFRIVLHTNTHHTKIYMLSWHFVFYLVFVWSIWWEWHRFVTVWIGCAVLSYVEIFILRQYNQSDDVRCDDNHNRRQLTWISKYSIFKCVVFFVVWLAMRSLLQLDVICACCFLHFFFSFCISLLILPLFYLSADVSTMNLYVACGMCYVL